MPKSKKTYKKAKKILKIAKEISHLSEEELFIKIGKVIKQRKVKNA